ncbi:hypothetical protein IQ238_22740 [Pleurocapsales cyanobacterium LEGE 06147]|nr:hypothetical protein [Pleurocapsales cyanobacterium LEGE 06147]
MAKYKPYFERRHPWLERLIAILALLNLGLVLFDLSYLYGRNFYLRTFPTLTRAYDRVKGIQPHPETEYYLARADTLEAQLTVTGLDSPQAEELLAQLRLLSQRLIEENPFAGANKDSTLATIKQQMRARTGETFASDAFARFWSQAYLQQTNWQQELEFWNTEIRPLMQTNYYRGVGRLGKPIDYFWLLDLPFVLIFALDLLARIRTIHRRYRELSWFDAFLQRWYDLFLLLPFWRWLRIIPVSIRLYHSDFLNLEPVRAEAQRDLVISFAVELTEMVGIQIINQMQASIRRGDLIHWLFDPEPPYVQVGGRKKLQAVTTRLLDISVRNVFPKVRPDIEELVYHSIISTLHQLPGYRKLQHLPGLRRLSSQLTKKLANESLSRFAPSHRFSIELYLYFRI